jgi:hypothetical protein
VILQTESGTKYHLKPVRNGYLLMREPGNPDQATSMDGRWIRFVLGARLTIGQPTQFICEPQTPGVQVTLLNTTKITGVIW